MASGGIQGQPVLPSGVFSVGVTVGWCETLSAALDCYSWVLEDQLLSPRELFTG